MPGKDPTGRIVNNAVQSNRYANGLARHVSLLMADAGKELAALIRDKEGRGVFRPAGVIFHDLYGKAQPYIADQLTEYALLQQGWAAGTLEAAVGAVAVDITTKGLGRQFWKAIIQEDPTARGLLVEGHSMPAWWAKQEADAKFLFRRQIQQGMANQETVDQIVRRVRGRSIGGGRYTGGVIQATTRHATALVRTAVNQVSNRAHSELYAANSDITPSYKYVATLDARTTMICASLDGQVFRHGEGPLPPQHFNCRSTTTPVIDYAGLGISPPPEGKRASRDGPVPAKTDYEGWLKGQDAATQNKVLGPKRAAMFRRGDVSLRDLVRKDNSVLTLDQLAERIG